MHNTSIMCPRQKEGTPMKADSSSDFSHMVGILKHSRMFPELPDRSNSSCLHDNLSCSPLSLLQAFLPASWDQLQHKILVVESLVKGLLLGQYSLRPNLGSLEIQRETK